MAVYAITNCGNWSPYRSPNLGWNAGEGRFEPKNGLETHLEPPQFSVFKVPNDGKPSHHCPG